VRAERRPVDGVSALVARPTQVTEATEMAVARVTNIAEPVRQRIWALQYLPVCWKLSYSIVTANG
jgi:hypothetical protein